MISVFGSDISQAEVDAVSKVMQSQWSGFGKVVTEFEELYKQKYKIDNYAMVDSGSNALYMAIHLLNLPANSDVIVPSFTWVSCAQAVILCGHNPIFCDVDIDTMNITVEHIRKVITGNTRAIMIVHYAGLSVDIDPIKELGLPIIEDAAHAVDSTYKGKPCGTLDEVGIYSYDAVKNLTVGEGGGIATSSSEMIERAKMLRYCGIGKSGFEAAATEAGRQGRWWEYNIQEPFIKMLPTNINAAIGVEQLKRIDMLQARRKQIWGMYQNAFSNCRNIITPVEAPRGSKHSYFTYCIRVEGRNELASYLLQNGIYTTLRYHPLHMNSIYKQTDIQLPNSEKLNETALSIPLHPRLTDDEVTLIIDKVKCFFKSNSR